MLFKRLFVFAIAFVFLFGFLHSMPSCIKDHGISMNSLFLGPSGCYIPINFSITGTLEETQTNLFYFKLPSNLSNTNLTDKTFRVDINSCDFGAICMSMRSIYDMALVANYKILSNGSVKLTNPNSINSIISKMLKIKVANDYSRLILYYPENFVKKKETTKKQSGVVVSSSNAITNPWKKCIITQNSDKMCFSFGNSNSKTNKTARDCKQAFLNRTDYKILDAALGVLEYPSGENKICIKTSDFDNYFNAPSLKSTQVANTTYSGVINDPWEQCYKLKNSQGNCYFFDNLDDILNLNKTSNPYNKKLANFVKNCNKAFLSNDAYNSLSDAHAFTDYSNNKEGLGGIKYKCIKATDLAGYFNIKGKSETLAAPYSITNPWDFCEYNDSSTKYPQEHCYLFGYEKEGLANACRKKFINDSDYRTLFNKKMLSFMSDASYGSMMCINNTDYFNYFKPKKGPQKVAKTPENLTQKNEPKKVLGNPSVCYEGDFDISNSNGTKEAICFIYDKSYKYNCISYVNKLSMKGDLYKKEDTDTKYNLKCFTKDSPEYAKIKPKFNSKGANVKVDNSSEESKDNYAKINSNLMSELLNSYYVPNITMLSQYYDLRRKMDYLSIDPLITLSLAKKSAYKSLAHLVKERDDAATGLTQYDSICDSDLGSLFEVYYSLLGTDNRSAIAENIGGSKSTFGEYLAKQDQDIENAKTTKIVKVSTPPKSVTKVAHKKCPTTFPVSHLIDFMEEHIAVGEHDLGINNCGGYCYFVNTSDAGICVYDAAGKNINYDLTDSQKKKFFAKAYESIIISYVKLPKDEVASPSNKTTGTPTFNTKLNGQQQKSAVSQATTEPAVPQATPASDSKKPGVPTSRQQQKSAVSLKLTDNDIKYFKKSKKRYEKEHHGRQWKLPTRETLFDGNFLDCKIYPTACKKYEALLEKQQEELDPYANDPVAELDYLRKNRDRQTEESAKLLQKILAYKKAHSEGEPSVVS